MKPETPYGSSSHTRSIYYLGNRATENLGISWPGNKQLTLGSDLLTWWEQRWTQACFRLASPVISPGLSQPHGLQLFRSVSTPARAGSGFEAELHLLGQGRFSALCAPPLVSQVLVSDGRRVQATSLMLWWF